MKSAKKVSIFFPLRFGSKRVLNKNTRPFLPNGQSLFELKLEQLLKLANSVEEIVISTNDETILQQFNNYPCPENVSCVVRPEFLCLSTTKVSDLIEYVPTVIKGNVVLWVHATSPFVDDQDYLKAIERYLALESKGICDSLMSVNIVKQFLWSEKSKCLINPGVKNGEWPNTQDLEPLYEINHAFYINSVSNYKKYNNRIGLRPGLFECEGLKRIDVDHNSDFVLAQTLSALDQSRVDD